MKKALTNTLGSPTTTVLGVLAFITATSIALTAFLDGNPETVPNWDTVVVAFLAMLGFGAAKEN